MTKIESLLKEHADAMARRETARLAFIAADADARGLVDLCFEQGRAGVPGASLDYNKQWLNAGERIADVLRASLLAEASIQQVAEARQRWRAVLEIAK